MKQITNFILEKLHLGKNSKTYTRFAELINIEGYEHAWCWCAYSPSTSKGKPQMYRCGISFHPDNKIHIAGPYIGRPRRMCLMCDLKKNVQFDDNTIVVGKITHSGYMFMARDKEALDQLTDKIFLMKLKLSIRPDYNNEENTDIKLKEYLEENLDIY